MKRQISFISLLLMIFFTLLTSDCNKKSAYIDKYFGMWDFEYRWAKSDGPFYTSDTTFFTGSMYQGACDNCLIVLYSEGKTLELNVEQDGQILNHCEPPPNSLHSSYSCSGYFEGTNLFHYEIYSATPPNHRVIISSLILGNKL